MWAGRQAGRVCHPARRVCEGGQGRARHAASHPCQPPQALSVVSCRARCAQLSTDLPVMDDGRGKAGRWAGEGAKGDRPPSASLDVMCTYKGPRFYHTVPGADGGGLRGSTPRTGCKGARTARAGGLVGMAMVCVVDVDGGVDVVDVGVDTDTVLFPLSPIDPSLLLSSSPCRRPRLLASTTSNPSLFRNPRNGRRHVYKTARPSSAPSTPS